MTNLTEIIVISPTDLSYIAGYIDGEGHIGITKVKNGSCKAAKSPYYRLYVGVSNTNLNAIEWMHGIFHGNIHKKRLQEKCKQLYQWTLQDRLAYGFLKAVAPYLMQKRPQADLAIAFFENKKQDAHGISMKPFGGYVGSTHLSQEELAKRDNYYQKMKALNKRGRR